MAFNVNALGFGDNVVDRYEHIHTMYPGGNAVNFAVYAKKCGAARSAYMGIFGNDAAAEHVIASILHYFRLRIHPYYLYADNHSIQIQSNPSAELHPKADNTFHPW